MRLLRWMVSALVLVTVQASAAEDPMTVWRNRTGTINYAPRPRIYTVTGVDTYNRVVRLRARNGLVAEVYVSDAVYDLSKLQVGSQVRVDFLVPEENSERLAAATIWPLR